MHHFDYTIFLQRASLGWCEKMIDVAEDSSYSFYYTLISKFICLIVGLLLIKLNYPMMFFLISLVRFRIVLSPQPTPAALYLMKRCQWAGSEEISKLNHIEICPKAIDLTQNIAKRISSDGGGALIIDYGLNGVVSDSLQVLLNINTRTS